MRNIPETTFKTRVLDESVTEGNPYAWRDLPSKEIFKGRRVIIFSIPGAFTPTCSSNHLPRFEEMYNDFRLLGIDEVYCLSVNDAFVMFQWGKSLGVESVKLLPDGNGEFTSKMGMLVKKDNLGFGPRSWRYSMLVDDSKIVKIFSEAGQSDNHEEDPFEVSDADTIMRYLQGVDTAGAIAEPSPFIG